jgi:hypothetical protein
MMSATSTATITALAASLKSPTNVQSWLDHPHSWKLYVWCW